MDEGLSGGFTPIPPHWGCAERPTARRNGSGAGAGRERARRTR